MAFFLRIFPLLFLIAFLLGELPLAAQDRVPGEIVRWIDGDTCDFKTDDGKTIRVQLWLADAPEPDQPLGEKATEFVRTNANFGEGKKAELKSLSQDRYERTIGILYTPGGRSCLEEFFASGYFWYLTYSARDNPTAAAPLHRLFNSAQRAKRGVFQFSTSVPPWRWRKMSDTEKEDATKRFERESGITVPRPSRTPSLRDENSSNDNKPPNAPDPAVRSSSPATKQPSDNESEDFVTIIVLAIFIAAAVVCWITWRLTKVAQAQRSQTTSSASTHTKSRSWPDPNQSLPVSGPTENDNPKGWERSEIDVFEELTNKLPKSEYAIIDDALFEIEGEDRSSQMDHLVISAYGVFVIETKAWHGKITGNETEEEWTQKVNDKFYNYRNPIRQNARHVEFLKRILSDNKIETQFVPFVPIVVFDDFAELDVEAGNNIVIYKHQLVEVILRHKNQITSLDLRNRIIEVLLQNLKRGKEAKNRHIDRVKGNH